MYGMAFCTNHKECEKFAEEAEGHGLRCRIVTGKEARGRAGQTVINASVDALIQGEIDLIVTVEKLATGFNRPEVNAIISARITSAAKTIQYIGRRCRSFAHTDGREKENCHVFETNWTLKRNAKRGKKPLRVADALELNGEQPESICSMADGSPLEYEQEYLLREDGTADVKGIECIGEVAYAKVNGLQYDTLKKTIRHAGLLSLGQVKGRGPRINLYEKSKVE